jgi:hypothetical protein
LLGITAKRGSVVPGGLYPARQEPLGSMTQLGSIFRSLLPTKLGEGLLPVLLAPFMGGISYKDLITLLYIWSTRTRRGSRRHGLAEGRVRAVAARSSSGVMQNIQMSILSEGNVVASKVSSGWIRLTRDV